MTLRFTQIEKQIRARLRMLRTDEAPRAAATADAPPASPLRERRSRRRRARGRRDDVAVTGLPRGKKADAERSRVAPIVEQGAAVHAERAGAEPPEQNVVEVAATQPAGARDRSGGGDDAYGSPSPEPVAAAEPAGVRAEARVPASEEPSPEPAAVAETPGVDDAVKDAPGVDDASKDAPGVDDAVKDAPAPAPVDGPAAFRALGLPDTLLRGLAEIGFEEPTPIQLHAIKPALEGRDLVGQARTGTGKTAAFGLPMLARTVPGEPHSALVLAPTRELAHQVCDALEDFAKYSGLRMALIYGGVSYTGQKRALASGAEVIVGTPGRILDLHGQGVLKLSQVKIVVLDECDRMFDLGFRPDIIKVLRHSKPSREQLLLFSATIDGNVQHLAQRFMTEPTTIETIAETLTVDQVEQHYCVVSPKRKTALIAELIRREEASGELEQAIVFCRTKSGCDRLAKRLQKQGLRAHAIHGDLRQPQRERVLQALRERKVKLLIATNVAARGLDVGGISHVFNYDVPEYSEDYVHRIGRTARMGAKGKAYTLVEPGQGGLVDEIEKLTGALVREMRVEGFDMGLTGRTQRALENVSGTILFRSSHGR
jgi:ATP-dependent RNA helicase DeaD